MIIGFLRDIKHGPQRIARSAILDLPISAVQELEAVHPGAVVRLTFAGTAVAVAGAFGRFVEPLMSRAAAFRIIVCPECQQPGAKRMTVCPLCRSTGKLVVT